MDLNAARPRLRLFRGLRLRRFWSSERYAASTFRSAPTFRGAFVRSFAIRGHAAQGVKRLPRDTGGIGDPVFFGTRIAAARAALLDHRRVGRIELVANLTQFLARFHLDTEMID